MAVSAVVLILGGLAGCASDDMGPDWMTWDQANREYQAAVASFPFALPEGVSFTPDARPPGGDTHGRYGRGYGAMQAYVFAEYAWACTALRERVHDPVAASAALDEVQRIHDSPGIQANFSDPGGGWQAMIDKTRLGDWADFAQTYSGFGGETCGA